VRLVILVPSYQLGYPDQSNHSHGCGRGERLRLHSGIAKGPFLQQGSPHPVGILLIGATTLVGTSARLGMPAQAVARLEDLVPCLATVGGE
jgi:hypothetical protein